MSKYVQKCSFLSRTTDVFRQHERVHLEHSHQTSLNSHEMELYQNHLIIIRKMSFSIPSSLRLGNIMITENVQL